jgi:hypothetical protein
MRTPKKGDRLVLKDYRMRVVVQVLHVSVRYENADLKQWVATVKGRIVEHATQPRHVGSTDTWNLSTDRCELVKS